MSCINKNKGLGSCVHVYTRTCTHTRTRTTHTHTCTHVRVHTHVRVYTHTYVYTRVLLPGTCSYSVTTTHNMCTCIRLHIPGTHTHAQREHQKNAALIIFVHPICSGFKGVQFFGTFTKAKNSFQWF
jgi:hypothetical protein